MRSKASFHGHPIHPMLIPFPLAFLVGTLVSDLGAALFGFEDLLLVAWYIAPAGITMGAVAAVPGLIDLVRTVPPRSTGRRRGIRHMVVNATALLLFLLAWILRGGPGVAVETAIVGIEGAGAALLLAGGWMGGTLAYRNQIGVDHRYANAGRWSEEDVELDEDGWASVARTDELKINQMKLVRVDDSRVVLARSEAGWVAFEDHCPHRGGSLSGGLLACDVVTCPWHGSQFDVRSGAVRAGPADQGIRTFPVEEAGGEVRLNMVG